MGIAGAFAGRNHRKKPLNHVRDTEVGVDPDLDWARYVSQHGPQFPSHPYTRSAADQLLKVFGVPGTLCRDLRGSALDLAKIAGRELEVDGSDILVETLELPGAGNRDDPQLLGEQPGERDPGGRRLLPFRHPAKHVDEGHVRLSRLGREARDDIAEIGDRKRVV